MVDRTHAAEASGPEPEHGSEPSALRPPADFPSTGAGRRRWIFLSIFVLGTSSIVTQLVLMRELMCVFSGNELVIGIVLGSWLATTGLGTYLGRGVSRLKRPIQSKRRWI